MGDGIERTLGASASMFFNKYVVFAGRAPRAEYWWSMLFIVIAEVILGAVQFIALDVGSILLLLFALVIILPSISVMVRRLHDIDRSGWWFWIQFVPLVGFILILVWFCTKGTSGPNRFGPENGLIA